jgi:peroxiredoxin
LKKILLLVLLFVPAWAYCCFTDSVVYVIKGVSDVKEGIVILNNRATKDTITIKNGRFLFKGKVKQPVLGLLEIWPPGGIPANVILEQGEITVTLKNGNLSVGGTGNNTRYQQIRDQTLPFRKAVAVLQDSSMRVVGLAKRKWSAAIDSVEHEKAKATGKWVRENKNFAGLVALLSTYRKDTPTNLAYYLETLKAFSTDPGYQLISEYYKSMLKIEKGAPVPSFTLQDINGQMVSLASFKGKYVLVDFWYHNCGFCRQMMPSLVKIYADLKQKGFEIVSISIDAKASEQDWRKAIKDDGATWTELWDYDKTMPDQYGVAGYPHLFLLDREGKLLQQVIGYQDESVLRKILSAYLP